MTTVSKLMLCALVCVGMMTTSARADEPTDKMTHRWGVGWDDGMGFRYRLSETWGVGMSLSPSVIDRSSESQRFEDSMLTVNPPRDLSSKSIGFSVMLYREQTISRWLDVGPFVRAHFGYSDSEDRRTGPPSDVHQFQARRQFRIEVGIRPTFTYKNRFVLESRFGFGVRYNNNDYWSRSTYGGEQVRMHSSDDDWSGFTFGEELGPGSVLQFIIYF